MTADEKYRDALELYRETPMTITEISRQCGLSRAALAAYIRRNQRNLMFRRRGIGLTEQETETKRLHAVKGQRPFTQARYRQAIEACRSRDNLTKNISEIARIFHLSPTGLGNQLRRHFPEIISWREGERQRLGIADNLHRGANKTIENQYAEAVEHLGATDDTIRHTAALFNVSYSGLREHLLQYHKGLVNKRERKRTAAKSLPKVKGALTGNGTPHQPDPEMDERYKEAVRLYRETSLTQKEIAAQLGISLSGFRNHIRVWHRDIMHDPKSYRRATAAKYADAIATLKNGDLSIAAAAKKHGLNPSVFRRYLLKHEPALAAAHGKNRQER